MLKIRVIFSRMTRGQVVQSNLVERDTCFATTALLVTGSNPTVESGILTAGSVSVSCVLYKSEHGALYIQAASQNEVHVSRRKSNYHAEIEAVNRSCKPKIYAFENPE